jgi:hypothetical protein
MNKIYWLFIIIMSALAIFWTEKSFSQQTTILAPDGSVTICQVSNGIVICV